MTENMINELNQNDMNEVSGGRYQPLPEKTGFFQYHIQPGDNLIKIAKRFNTTESLIMTWNPKIKNKNLIYAGDYLYIKQ